MKVGSNPTVHVGRGHIGEDYAAVEVRGLRLRFTPGDGLASRHVVITGDRSDDDRHFTLKDGVKSRFAVNGHDVVTDGRSMKIDGVMVFNTKGDGAVDSAGKATPAQALAALEARFPGVKFGGDLHAAGLVNIGPEVRIAAGARVDLSAGLELRGKTTLGAEAFVTGDAKIRDSKIEGGVTGGVVNDSKVLGLVRGGVVEGSTIGTGGVVSAGVVRESTIEDSTVSGGCIERSSMKDRSRVTGGLVEASKLVGARVSGGEVIDMKLGRGTTVSGGFVEGFRLRDQDVSGGFHYKRLNPQWDEQAKETRASEAFAPQVRETAESYGRFDPGLYRMDYAGMMNTYDPRLMGYASMMPYGGYAMPPAMFGAPGIVANPYAGFGTTMLAGMGAGALLGMGMGAFGMGMYGLGMGTFGLGFGMGGLGLGGFNWWCW